MNAEEILKALGGLFGVGGLGWAAFRYLRGANSADAVALKENAGRINTMDYQAARIRELETANDQLRKEAVEAGRFSAKAELLTEQVAKVEKTLLEATAQIATLHAELAELKEESAKKEATIAGLTTENARLRQKMIDHGVSPD